ncbi:sensor histidine kinase [Mucilaginibacter gotjawali]|uniref:Signal transduction histidine kinase n=2 Tax=Mucilaginibacter gotjawali TaxID=1550579 RepID=A0A839SCY8_9SPHI|nr:CHASE3 domain-containing protein [Mucilaginibacter gotjawali]MBB3056061.1 signal transduction histidine kinase [Mucilaginibacter gotjawali]BAU53602.1 Aerobic respiration control sensor protein ArcB [Mucilaginibacter gotjawali]
MRTSIRQKLFLFSLIVLAGNGVTGYAVYQSNQRLFKSEQMVRHTEQVIYQSGNVLSIAKDIETAAEGYVITNDSTFLKPFYLAKKSAFNSISDLKELTRDNPGQQIRIDSLNGYLHKLLDFATKTIKIRQEQGLMPAVTFTSNKQGKYLGDQIRKITSAVQQTENVLLRIRKQTNGRSQIAFKQLSRVIFISMVAFTILLLILIDRYFLQNKEKEKRTIELALANEERTKMVGDLMLRNMDLEQFAYIISHNLRAPVANIIGASSVLNDNDLSLTDKETIFKGINVSVTRLDEVVKDLNHILQVKGDINETKEIVHFSTLVEEIKSSIQNLIDKYNIEITYDFSAIDGFLTLRGYLYSIFYNLISNSIKYRRKEIHSIIEVKSRLENNKLELLFSDNGMGINLKKNGDQVFGLYKRFHSTAEGKGLGLFMVKTQVVALGGKITVQSLENEGTEFKIEFQL